VLDSPRAAVELNGGRQSLSSLASSRPSRNISRDWAIDKTTIGVTYDSEIELARQPVKKIGQELPNHPESVADIIDGKALPLSATSPSSPT
jgi:small-conductance mechanosensitive channel